jgi:hypothetical protein
MTHRLFNRCGMRHTREMRMLGRAGVVVGALFGVATLSAGAASADGAVQLRSRLGEVCLDAPSGSWVTALVINPCNGSDFQRWNLTATQQLESVAFSGECLSMPGDSWYSHLGPCIDTYAQHWTIQPNGQVKSGVGACLTVLGGPGAGTWVSTRFCDGDSDQGWDAF